MNNILDTQHVSFTSLHVRVCGGYKVLLFLWKFMALLSV